MRLFIVLLTFSNLIFSAEYGSKITMKNAIPLKQAIKEKKKNVLIKAKVGKVCEAKGCWMVLESKDSDVRVTFKDYSFFVPLSLIGKNVLVQGELKSHTMSKNEARHMAKDAGKSQEEILKIVSPVTEYRMIASGIKTTK